MSATRRIVLSNAAFVLVAAVIAPTASAHDRRGPSVTRLAAFGNGGFVTGSTIAPDGALYVTDGNAGSVLRINRRNGHVSTYATGLPRKALPDVISGPVDIAFVGRTAYVLVTLVSGKAFGQPFGNSADKNGIYRLECNGSFTLVADIGQWSVDHPPVPAFFIDTGVQYAMLSVTRHGSISQIATFGNLVPTGLEVTKGRVFVTQLGPNPHIPATGRVLELRRGSDSATCSCSPVGSHSGSGSPPGVLV